MRRNKNHLTRLSAVALVVLLALSMLSGCTPQGKVNGNGGSQAKYPMEVVDSTGRTVTITAQPERIVSLAPSNTEVLYACGLGDKVVGVTTFCNYPEEVGEKEKVGGFSDPSIEKIVELDADLVLATTIHEKYLAEMEKLGLKVLVLNPATVEDVMDEIKLVGDVTGNSEQAEKTISEMQSKIDKVQTALKDLPDEDRVKIFYLLWDEPIMSIGPSTLLHDVITLAGGISVSADADTDYPTYSLEVLIEKDPEAIVFTVMGSGGGIDPESLKTQAGWSGISAIKNDRVYGIDDDLMSRPGPRIADGLLEVAKALYPDLFPNSGE
ncbi:MAG: cobalamin-binding protein [Firmicutes bacterium]|nr:cobalamin-binding protein [Candidatus Fermentithermobacillaceae bacterium]